MKKKELLFLLVLLLLIGCRQTNESYQSNKGAIFGTYYSITYLHPQGEDLHEKIEQKLQEFDLSLSTYNSASIISRINQNDETVETDAFFETMFEAAQEISKQTDGAFDITVAPLVNAWGFGFDVNDKSKEPDITSILPYVGYEKVALQNKKIVKQDERIMLDASAIAKGQSCDVIGALLDANGCSNYMVEIGGEVYCKGLNPQGEKWRIAIDKPYDDPANELQEFQTILSISGVGMATSGNYRQFYVLDGKKYAHTIDPKSGSPVSHNLLSATVLAKSCMVADAYATAFMVMGLERSMKLCKQIEDLDCFLIYEDNAGLMQTTYSDGFEKYLTEEYR